MTRCLAPLVLCVVAPGQR